MDTTFGDLLDGAWTHLGGATMHAHPQLGGDITAAAKDACRSLTARLARCAEDFTRADDIAQPIHEASRLLTRLGGYTSAAAARHPLALHLRAASTSWGAAGDMLATHFTRRGDAPRSDWAAVISDEQVRDGLLSEVADHTLALVAVMDRSGLTRDLDTQTACSLLRSSALRCASRSGDAASLRAVPLNEPPWPPQPVPQEAQTPHELSAGIIDGSDALRALCHRPQELSPRQWQRTALAASIISDIAAKSLTQLTRRCYELNPHRQQALGKALQQATDVVQRANAEWKGVRQAWHGQVAAGPLSASVREQHLDQMTVRLGRLLHDNPRWTPARQDRAPLKAPAVIAPAIADMVPIARAVLHAFEGLTVVAGRDRQDVRRVLRADVGQPGRRQLLAAYEQLGSPKARASLALSEAMLLAAPPELRDELWQDIRILELRRNGTLDGSASARTATLHQLKTLIAGADGPESRLDLSTASRTAGATIPPAPTSSLRRSGNRFR
ncbi:hypothetical protein SAMN05421833_129107 [Microbispora rosea]|uniref:Uncharacterized protein n=1 Tax=Microbispora rosea TaxID=58117 RepID=A0A1N7GJP3_9ACTN|nr:hypothetical protein [Microbispora rosea]GIH51699.1 hypothetical protein Mro03_68780 [Microbispora rosea subsp. rosea]SIS12726.1 hypothetical protein SAMN05421833_129107 [Microbispora rosea]